MLNQRISICARGTVAVLLVLFLGNTVFANLPDIETAILEKDFTKAESLAQTILASNSPDSHLAYYYLGLSRLGLEKNEEARETFNQLIMQNPPQPLLDKAYIGVIDSYLLSADYPNALTVSEALFQLNPKSEFLSLIYLKLARANLKMAQWEKARVYLTKITKEFPDSLEYHLAKQLLEEKQFFTVQIGSFLERDRAVTLADQFKERGEYAYIVETVDHQGRKFYRVRLGQFSALEQAENFRQELSKSGYPTRIYP